MRQLEKREEPVVEKVLQTDEPPRALRQVLLRQEPQQNRLREKMVRAPL